MLKRSLAECKTSVLDGFAPGGRVSPATSDSNAVLDGL
jgi:hypothetical protein